ERRHELLSGDLVVVAAVGPEEQRVAADLRERGVGNALRVADNRLEQPLLADAERRQLVVDDRIDRDRRLRQPVGQRLLTSIELAKAVGLELQEAGVRDALDQRARALGGRLRPDAA